MSLQIDDIESFRKQTVMLVEYFEEKGISMNKDIIVPIELIPEIKKMHVNSKITVNNKSKIYTLKCGKGSIFKIETRI